MQKMEPNDFQVHFHFGVTLVRESQMFRALVEKENKHQIRLLRYHWKDLEVKMPKVPSRCSFKIDVHELQKKGRESNWEFDS
jgi:hypothetical protein